MEGGVPGALSNQPPMPATAPITTPPGSPLSQTPTTGAIPPATPDAQTNAPTPPSNTRKDATINYEVDKRIQHVRRPVGGIKRLSVAVVVNHRKVTDQDGAVSSTPLTEAQTLQITDLVKEAMGFSKERGDTLNVVNSPFSEMHQEITPELPLWKQPEMIELAQQIGKNLLIAGLILYLVLGVLRPMLKRATQPPAPLLAETTKDKEELPVQPVPILKPASPEYLQYEENLAFARQIARDDPKVVANVIKQWVAGHG
jgi:flagellar M-ring protein FliF